MTDRTYRTASEERDRLLAIAPRDVLRQVLTELDVPAKDVAAALMKALRGATEAAYSRRLAELGATMDETLVPPGEWQQARREHDQKVLELGRERLAALRRLRGQAT